MDKDKVGIAIEVMRWEPAEMKWLIRILVEVMDERLECIPPVCIPPHIEKKKRGRPRKVVDK